MDLSETQKMNFLTIVLNFEVGKPEFNVTQSEIGSVEVKLQKNWKEMSLCTINILYIYIYIRSNPLSGSAGFVLNKNYKEQ